MILLLTYHMHYLRPEHIKLAFRSCSFGMIVLCFEYVQLRVPFILSLETSVCQLDQLYMGVTALWPESEFRRVQVLPQHAPTSLLQLIAVASVVH